MDKIEKVYCNFCGHEVKLSMANDDIKYGICQDCKKIVFSQYRTQAERREIFNVLYNGQRNFMTPHVDYFYGNSLVLMELSHGMDFNDRIFYGVTVIKKDSFGNWVKAYQGQAFIGTEARNKALEYIKELKHQYHYDVYGY